MLKECHSLELRNFASIVRVLEVIHELNTSYPIRKAMVHFKDIHRFSFWIVFNEIVSVHKTIFFNWLLKLARHEISKLFFIMNIIHFKEIFTIIFFNLCHWNLLIVKFAQKFYNLSSSSKLFESLSFYLFLKFFKFKFFNY